MITHSARTAATSALALAFTLSASVPPALAAQPPAIRDGETRFGLAAGVLVPTVVSVGGERLEAAPGPLLLIGFDRPLRRGSEWEVGGFLDVGSFSAGARDDQVNLVQLGAGLYYTLPDTWGGLLRLGARGGYRHLFADAHGFDGVRGLALDAVAQWIKAVSPAFVGQVELSVLSEPIGGNEAGLLFFGPFPALAIGMCF